MAPRAHALPAAALHGSLSPCQPAHKPCLEQALSVYGHCNTRSYPGSSSPHNQRNTSSQIIKIKANLAQNARKATQGTKLQQAPTKGLLRRGRWHEARMTWKAAQQPRAATQDESTCDARADHQQKPLPASWLTVHMIRSKHACWQGLSNSYQSHCHCHSLSALSAWNDYRRIQSSMAAGTRATGRGLLRIAVMYAQP